MTPIRIGSLFSGVGGLDLGISQAFQHSGIPITHEWFCEADTFCQSVLQSRWPNTKVHTDVREITATTATPIHVLIGGFPCQDLSVAGDRAGLAGSRSGLFWEMHRIAVQLRPHIVIMENVAGIASIDGAVQTVCGAFSEAGYDCVWGMLRANHPSVGAPHRRERWFCIAYMADADQVVSGRDTGAVRCAEGEAQETGHQQRQGVGCGGATTRSESIVADASSPRLQERQLASVTEGPGQRGGCDTEDDRHAGGMADTNGRQRQSERFVAGMGWQQLIFPQGEEDGQGEAVAELGGVSYGIPTELDITKHRWPCPPGPEQHPWEPPRADTEDCPNRRNRLKALGNAVVPQQAYQIGLWCVQNLIEVTP